MREAIESVRNQIYPHWELCISDDASTLPGVRELIETQAAQDKRIRVTFRAANGHISANSNTALDLATGDYVALLDADDVLTEDALFWVAHEIALDPANRHDLLRRGQDRPGGAALRSLLQAGVESRADARAEHVLPSRRLPPQPGRAGRPLPRRLRGRAGSRSGAALRRRDHARAHPPHPARALSLARDRATRPRPRWRASPMRSRPA